MSWTDGKTRKEIQAVLDKRAATRAANKKKKERALKRQEKKSTTAQEARQTTSVAVNKHNTAGTVTFEDIQMYFVEVYLHGVHGRLYTYRTDIAGLEPGNLVVVNAAGVVQIAEVRNVRTRNISGYTGPLKWVIQKVEMDEYLKREQQRARKAELLATMQHRKKQIDEETVFEAYADKDPTFAAMLEEFKSLSAV